MYQTWQWPTQSTDTTYAQPSTAVAPTASTAAAAPAAAAAVAANTWPVQAAYGQYAVANTLQQQWAWAAQNQYAYAASLAAGQQGSTATGVYPGVWPGQAASAAVATTTDAKTAASTTVATATTVAASVAKTEASKEELVPKDSSEMEKLNQLRAQAQQWTSQQQTAAWGMQSGATTAATPAASLTATSAVAAPAATAATAAVAAGWPQTSWNQSTWPSGQWSNQTQWQQSWSQQGQAATASAATQGATQAKASEATATEKDAKDETKSVADSNDKQADSSTADLDKEEEEFDRQFHEWEKQFEAWKEQNKNHPDKEAFAQYEKQWKAWREQLLQRKEEMRKKRAEKAASATPQAQGQAAVTGSATTTSNIPGLDLQDDKSSITTSAPSTSMPVAASVAPTQQVPVPTPAAATVAADQSLMYQSQVRMPPAQPYMYMPPQQFMYPPTMGAPPPTATAPPPMMTPQPQPQPLPYQSQPPPMMGQAEHHASGMQHPSVGSGAGVPDMAPVKKPLLDTPPPPGGMLPMPPGGSRYDDRPGGPHQMNEGHPHDMMPPPGGRMEPYGGRDPHLMGMEEEPYEDEWGYGRGRGMDFRGRGRGRGGTGRGRGRGSRWGDEFDGRPPLEHELPGPRRFEPGMRPPDDFPERFRRPGLDPDAFNPEFSVLESTKFPPDPGMEKPPDMPFDEEFGPRGRQGPPFPERRFGEGPPPPFDERGPPPPDQLRDRPRLPREPFDDMYPPERFGDRFPPPDRFDPKRGYPPPDEFDKRLPPPPGGPGGPEGFDDKRFPPDESRPGDKQRFPPGPPPPPGMHPRDDGRFMDERFGPRDRPPFGPPPPPPFEGDFPPPPPPFGDERFPPFDEGFRGMDRFARMRGERFPGRPFGPERFPPPPGPGEPPFGPGFPPDERFRFPDDREFRGPDRGPPPPPPPFRGGRFMEALRHNSIDYDNRPAAAVMGDEFNQKYDAFDPQFGSDIINYRDSCYMGYIPPPAEPIIFSQVDVQGFDYNHGKSPLVTSTIRGKKKDAKEEEKHSGRAFEYAQRRDRSPYRDRNYRDRDGDRPDHFRDSFRDRERERPRDRNRDRDRDDRSRDSDRERNRDRDRHRDRDKDDRKEREFERDRERSRDKDRDGPRRSRWEPRPESGGNAGRERSPDSSKKQNGERGKENLSNASDPAGQFPAVDLYSNSNDAIGEVADIKDLLYPPGRLTRPKQLVIILRGLPGSGKTHVARLIKDKEIEQGGCAPRILSLDDYFMVETEVTATDEETGKKVKKKEFQYEYEACMEEAYRASLLRSFKKTIDERFFPFIIVDAVHNEVKQFEPIWSYAKQRGFQVYIAEMDCTDPVICHKRNIHKRTLEDVAKLQERWEPKPRHFLGLDIRPLLQDVAIAEVEMEDSDAAQKNDDENDDSIDASMQFHVPSKWEKLEATEEKLDQLDGLRITKKKHSTMEDYLQLPDDYEDRQCEPGKKRVRWADLEERKEQDRLRAIGFVVGQTDWSKMTDPTHADRALTRTKYI